MNTAMMRVPICVMAACLAAITGGAAAQDGGDLLREAGIRGGVVVHHGSLMDSALVDVAPIEIGRND